MSEIPLWVDGFLFALAMIGLVCSLAAAIHDFRYWLADRRLKRSQNEAALAALAAIEVAESFTTRSFRNQIAAATSEIEIVPVGKPGRTNRSKALAAAEVVTEIEIPEDAPSVDPEEPPREDGAVL